MLLEIKMLPPIAAPNKGHYLYCIEKMNLETKRPDFKGPFKTVLGNPC